MKITKIECIPLTLPIKRSKPGRRTSSNHVLIKIHTDEGITGIAECGECGGAGSVYGDSQEQHIAAINKYFGPNILLGEDPRNIEKIVGKMARSHFGRQTMELVDFALHDIVGKKLGVPVYQLLGGLSNEKIPVQFNISRVLGWNNPSDGPRKAKEALQAGFQTIKLKVASGTLEEDIETVAAVREAIGPKAKLGVCANGAWNYYDALMVLKEMEKYNLIFAEQPVPWWDIAGLARLRKKVNIPISVDESAYQPHHVLEVIRREAADLLFLKITKAGGLIGAGQWVAIARAANLPVITGCMLGTGLECAAQTHFLAANEWMGRMAQQNDGPLLRHDVYDTVSTPITDDLVLNVPRYENGYLYPPDGPGLGVELNEELARKYITSDISPTAISI